MVYRSFWEEGMFFETILHSRPHNYIRIDVGIHVNRCWILERQQMCSELRFLFSYHATNTMDLAKANAAYYFWNHTSLKSDLKKKPSIHFGIGCC